MSSSIEEGSSRSGDLALGKVSCMFLSPSTKLLSGVGKINLSNSCKGFEFLGSTNDVLISNILTNFLINPS